MPAVHEIKTTLANLGIRPSKALGQHFLLDERSIEFMVREAAIQPGETVLEIGPGLGILTEALARAGARVIAVEKDRTLARYLSERFHNWKNVTIIQQNALLFDPAPLTRRGADQPPGSYKLVANLPYNITSPALRKFLENEPRPTLILVMIQKEVGERIIAPPANPKRGILSVMVQFFGQPEIVGHVSRTRFWPQPDVDSVILKISSITEELPSVNHKSFFVVVRAGFSKKRAQLKNALANSLHLPAPEVSFMLVESKIDPTKRAEELTVSEWVSLAQYLEHKGQ